MGNFFKSKAFIVLLTLLIVLGGVPTILSVMGQGSLVKDMTMAVVTPFMKGAQAVGNSFRGFYEYFTEFDRLKAENIALAKRVEELEGRLYDAELLVEENTWMRGYLGAKRTHTDFTFSDANLIGSESGKYISSFILDKGSAQGIKVGMPVLTEQGILGRITEVSLTFSRVSTIINYDSSVGAYVERTGEVGIVSGDFDRRKSGECVLEYLPFDTDVKVGDKVFSSGLGSVYPRDLYIGDVTEITGDPYDHTKIAIIKPASPMQKITRVMILTGYTVEVEAE